MPELCGSHDDDGRPDRFMVTLVNDGPGDVELLAVSVPDGSGFELLDTRILIAPLESLPGSGGRRPASIVDEPPLEGAVLAEGQGARPLLALRVVDTGVGSSSFDHVIVTTVAGELRYDVGLEVCYGPAGSSSC